MNWMIINGRFSERDANTRYQPILERLENDINSKQTEIDELQSSMKLEISIGPCVASLDETLKELKVDRQAYHGKSFVGNHCHTMLKVNYIEGNKSWCGKSFVLISSNFKKTFENLFLYIINSFHKNVL